MSADFETDGFWKSGDSASPSCCGLKIGRFRTKPYTLKIHGKAGRFIQALPGQWAYAYRYRASGRRTDELASWMQPCDFQRPHAATKHKPSPAPLTRGVVFHGDAALASSAEVDLVGADAETTYRHQLLRAVEDFFGQLGPRADTNEVRVGDLFLELGFGY